MGGKLIYTYGEPTIKIPARCNASWEHSQSDSFENEIWVFEPYKLITINGVLYEFRQITGYSVSVNNQIVSSSTRTSTGSALGRAVVGAALLGEAGAVIGAITANKSTDYETRDKTVITIFTNSISNPAIVLDLFMPTKEDVAKIEGVLRIITSMDESEKVASKRRKFMIGDIVTVKESGQEIVIVDVESDGDSLKYLGDSGDRYYSEDELE